MGIPPRGLGPHITSPQSPCGRRGIVVIINSKYDYIYNMKKIAQSRQVEVGIRDLKSQLSKYIDRVQKGDEIIVTEHGKPVARISPVSESKLILERLIAEGKARPAQTKRSELPPLIDLGISLSEAIIEDRR